MINYIWSKSIETPPKPSLVNHKKYTRHVMQGLYYGFTCLTSKYFGLTIHALVS